MAELIKDQLKMRIESHNQTHAITNVIRDHTLIQDFVISNLPFQNSPL